MKNSETNTHNNTDNNVVLKTTDYDQFKIRHDNRDINPSHVARLKASLNNYNDLRLFPIIVNSEMEVVDGQHRLTAAKEMQIPVYYQVDDDYDPQKMIAFNTLSRSWNISDYLKYWSEHGRADYVKLKELQADLGFPVAILLNWFAGHSENTYKTFKIGAFRMNTTQEVMDGLISTKRLIDHMKTQNYKPIAIFTNRAFHRGCRDFFLNPLVESNRFFERLELIPYQIRYCRNSSEFIDQFVEIYNWKMKSDRLKVVHDGKRTAIIE